MTAMMPDTSTPDEEALAEALHEAVFELPEEMRAYLLIDAACSPDIHVTLDAFPEHARCLFDGEVGGDLAEVGPWLAELRPYGDLWDWFVDECWGRNRGVIIHSRLEFHRLKAHLKKFLMVEREDGEKNFFKYYRPRHLNTFLPLFDLGQRQKFMRGIDAWFTETPEDRRAVLVSRMREDDSLDVERFDLGS